MEKSMKITQDLDSKNVLDDEFVDFWLMTFELAQNLQNSKSLDPNLGDGPLGQF